MFVTSYKVFVSSYEVVVRRNDQAQKASASPKKTFARVKRGRMYSKRDAASVWNAKELLVLI